MLLITKGSLNWLVPTPNKSREHLETCAQSAPALDLLRTAARMSSSPTARADLGYDKPRAHTGMATFLKSLGHSHSIMGQGDFLRTDPLLSCQMLHTAQQKLFVTVLNAKARYAVLLKLQGVT